MKVLFVEWTLNVIFPEMESGGKKKKRADFPVRSALHWTLPLFQEHEMNQISAVRVLNSHKLEMACTLPSVALLEISSVIMYSCRWKVRWSLLLHNTSVGLNSKTASQNPPQQTDKLSPSETKAPTPFPLRAAVLHTASHFLIISIHTKFDSPRGALFESIIQSPPDNSSSDRWGCKDMRPIALHLWSLALLLQRICGPAAWCRCSSWVSLYEMTLMLLTTVLTRLVVDALQQTFLPSVCFQSVCRYVLVLLFHSRRTSDWKGLCHFVSPEWDHFFSHCRQSGCREAL